MDRKRVENSNRRELVEKRLRQSIKDIELNIIYTQKQLKQLSLLDRTDVKKQKTEVRLNRNNVIDNKNDNVNERSGTKRTIKGIFSATRVLSYYAKLKIELTNLLLFKIDEIVSLVDNYYLIVDSIHDRDRPLTTKGIKFLDLLSYYLRVWPGIILCFADMATDPNIKEVESVELWKPQGPGLDSFNYNDIAKICINPKDRYFVNDSYFSCRNVKTQKSKDGPDELSKIKKVNFNMFLKFSDQSRWGNVWYQALSVIFWRDVTSIHDRLENLTTVVDIQKEVRYGLDLISMRTFLRLIGRYDALPFYTTDTGKITVNEATTKDLPLSLPLLLTSLLELGGQEMGCNILGNELVGALKTRLVAARHSFGTYMLNRKSKYTDCQKLLWDASDHHIRYNYFDQYCKNFSLKEYKNQKEVWTDEKEKQQLEDTLIKLDADFILFINNFRNKILKKGEVCQKSEALRYATMVCTIWGNPGVYYKTSLVLEAEASILPKIEKIIPEPKFTEFINFGGVKYPFKADWSTGSPVLKSMVEHFKEGLHLIHSDLETVDLMRFFVQLLTNNSQGIKVSLSELGFSEEDLTQSNINKLNNQGSTATNRQRIRLEIFTRTANARLIAFLLDQTPYMVLERFLEELGRDGFCTIRYQNNRRARIVEIVTNVEQIGYAPILYCFERLKKFWPEISVGKQKGGIIDMTSQLYSSGSPQIIKNSSDVAGMDASTQPAISKYQMRAFIEHLVETEIQKGRYFACGDTDVEIVDIDGNVIRRQVISGIVKALVHILQSKNSGKDFILKDGIFTDLIHITNIIFASGQFNTTAQHTLLLTAVDRDLKKYIKKKYPTVTLEIRSRAFGDDSSKLYISNLDAELQEEIVKDLVAYEKQLLHELGFKLEILISRVYADFLQQSSILGVQVPKSARASLFCDERGETRSRDPIALIKIMYSVLRSASQRYYVIENILTLILSIWLILRVITLRVDSEQVSKKLSGTEWKDYMYQFNQRTLIVLPYVTIFLPPMNVPNKVIMDTETQTTLRRRAFTSISGDIGWIWMLNELLTDDEWRYLLTVHSEPVEGALTLKGAHYLVRPIYLLLQKPAIKKFGILLGLGMLSYSRSNTLFGERRKALSVDLSTLTSKADAYRNPTKLAKSSLAAGALKSEFRINLPDRITYFGQSRARIEQAIEAVDETASDLPMLDIDMFEYLYQVATSVSKSIQENIDKFAIRYSFREGDMFDLTLDPIQEYKFPIIPGYTWSSDFGRLVRITGYSFRSEGRIFKLDGLGSVTRKNTRFDYEAALNYGLQSQRAGLRALELFNEAVGFTAEERTEFETLLRNYEDYVNAYNYSSQFSPSEYFGISGVIENFKFQWHSEVGIRAGLARLFNLITRDIIFAFVDVFKGFKVNYIPASYTLNYYLNNLRTRLGGLSLFSSLTLSKN